MPSQQGAGDNSAPNFTAAFEHLPHAAFVYNKDLVVTGLNRAAQDLLKLSPDAAGKRCRDVFHCHPCKAACPLLAGLNAASTQNMLRIGLGADQERQAVIRTSRLTGSSGETQGAVAIVISVLEAPAAHENPVAESELMKNVLRFARRVAASEAGSILLQGENGTGKDVVARVLHFESSRSAEPFVAINCAAMPETLLESELFGFEKGAFTDARSQKRGLFELAGKGTLFLDEIADLPLKLQAKLLGVLENQMFRRLGGLAHLRLEARVVAATNRNLFQAVERGEFRRDLYYRLNVIQIVVPPLRERPEDIIPLAEHYLEYYNRKFGRGITGISPRTEQILLDHDWPGNVRELKNAIERAAILEDSGTIQPPSLPPEIIKVVVNPDRSRDASLNGLMLAASTRKKEPESLETGMSLQGNELRLIKWSLEASNGNQTKAARLLGVSRDLLRYRMKKLALLPARVDGAATESGSAAVAVA